MTTEKGKPNPGTTDQRPRWGGAPELRPAGYLPATDDPNVDRDAAGEILKDPERSNLGEALRAKEALRKTGLEGQVRSTVDA